MKLKKAIRLLHLWLGLLSGLVICIVALTGSIFVFSYELQDVIYKDRYKIQTAGSHEELPVSELFRNASEVVPAGVPCLHVYIPAKPEEAVQFIFQKADYDAWTYQQYMQFYKTVFVDPYTGEVLYIENTKWEFFNVIFWLHTSLLLGYEPGNFIITCAVYIFLVMLLSGLYLWWPRNRRKKMHFWFQWKKKTSGKRKNYDLHRIPGFYVLPLALLLACTGLFWASEKFQHAATWLANGGATPEPSDYPQSDSTKVTAGPVIDKVKNTVLSVYPQTDYILIKSPRSASAPMVVRANSQKQEYKRTEFLFDQYSGELLSAGTFSDKNNGEKLAAINYDLHVGIIGGLSTQILALVAGIISASLPVTGFIIWKRRGKKDEKV